jgi:hypothetical protein
VVWLEQVSYTFSVLSNECYSLSHGFTHIAISEKENPTSLRIYDFRDQSLLSELPWQSIWPYPCEFWFNRTPSDRLTILLSDDYSRVVTFDTTIGREVEPIIPCLPSLSFDLEALPGILIANPMYITIPNSDLVIYQRCLDDLGNLADMSINCSDEQWVLYNPVSQTDLEILQNTPNGLTQLEGRPSLTELYFSVSPFGHYVSYPIDSGGKMVYDILNDRYLETSSILPLEASNLMSKDVLWSPDETRFVFSIRPTWDADSTFVVFNLNTNTTQALLGQYRSRTWEWAWFPDSQALAVITGDNRQLYRLGLDGTQTLIAENVERVFTYYPPPQ